jgi:uncharacterized membrane protein
MTTGSNFRYALLVASAAAWLGALFATPWLHGHFPEGAWVLYRFFSGICHQIPERSFYLAGAVLPVCARCLGLYSGFLLGAVTVRMRLGWQSLLLQQPRWILLFWIPLAVDLLSSNTHWSRFLTGGIAAYPVSIFVWMAILQLRVRNPKTTRNSI